MSEVHNIKSKNQLNEHINNSAIVVLDFYAEWCGPCVRIAPEFAKMAQAYPDYCFAKCNFDHYHEIAQEYGVTAMPTFIVFKNKQKYKTIIGADLDAIKAAMLPQESFQFTPFQAPVKQIHSVENFNHTIKNNSFVFIKFTAEWCGPCKLIHPTFAKLAEKYSKHIFAECDIDKFPDIASDYKIKTIPTIIVFQNGVQRDTWRELDSIKLTALVDQEISHI